MRHRKLLLIIGLFVSFSAGFVAAEGISDNGEDLKIQCDFPGKQVRAGDSVKFTLNIKNNGPQYPRRLGYNTNSEIKNWGINFKSNGEIVNKIDIPTGETKSIDLEVNTSPYSKEGLYQISIFISNSQYYVFLTIKKDVQHQTSFEVITPYISTDLGKNPVYEFKVKNNDNMGKFFKLEVNDLPSTWYYKIKSDRDTQDELQEIFIPSNIEKNLFLEIIPVQAEKSESMEFSALLSDNDGIQIPQNLSLSLKETSEVELIIDRYTYEIVQGEEAQFNLNIINKGNDQPLRNISVSALATNDWNVTIYPTYIPSISTGEQKKISFIVKPLNDVIPSDYKIKLVVTSDRNKWEDSVKIVVKENSYFQFIGTIILIIIIFFGYFMFMRKKRG